MKAFAYWAGFVVLGQLLHIPSALAIRESRWTYGILGDAGVVNARSRQVRESLLNSNVTQLILTGDNLYDTRLSYGEVWRDWIKSGFHFPIVALGNHHRSYEEEARFFRIPGEHYSRSNGTVRFVVLNSDNPETVGEQSVWLESELTRANEPFVFVVYHHPPVTLSRRHSWKEKERFHLQTRPILLRHQKKITGVLLGHDHIAALAQMNEIPLIVSGAVFESLPTPPVNYKENGIDVRTKWMFRGGSYWTRLDIDSRSGEAWVNFVRADRDEVSCSIRISPRPLLLRSNCTATGASLRAHAQAMEAE